MFNFHNRYSSYTVGYVLHVACTRWSFCSNSAWGRRETTTIGKTHPTLQGIRYSHFIFRKLITEASHCQQLKNFNIVQFYGMVLANEKNEVWLAMELLDGSLDTFLHNNQYEIPFDTQIKILLDASNGMEHVAGKGFVHRDLACRNIIYSVDNAG